MVERYDKVLGKHNKFIICPILRTFHNAKCKNTLKTYYLMILPIARKNDHL
jgi:hypothetical protein